MRLQLSSQFHPALNENGLNKALKADIVFCWKTQVWEGKNAMNGKIKLYARMESSDKHPPLSKLEQAIWLSSYKL